MPKREPFELSDRCAIDKQLFELFGFLSLFFVDIRRLNRVLIGFVAI